MAATDLPQAVAPHAMRIIDALTQATTQLLDLPTPRQPRKQAHPAPWAAAALALPGALSAAAPGAWDIDSAVLFYSETDRVQAIEPVISATRWFDTDRALNTKLVVDTLTGASPNGAVPSSLPQTYTQASGRGSYTVAPGTIPLDDTFRDTRVAISAGWNQPLSRHLVGNIGVSASNEYDYFSLGVDGGLAYALAQNNATLSLGLAYAIDTIEPEGGIPIRGSCLFGASADTGCSAASFDATRRGSEDSKDTVDVLLGYTQVLGVRTIAQLNLTLTQSDGYHNDPFKLVSVVDTDNSQGNGTGEPERHLHEGRPDRRQKQGIFARIKRQFFERDVLDAAYRFQTDDWGMQAHTLDLRYRWSFRGPHAITPHLRWYDQSAVDFYRPFLRDDAPLPDFFTADYRQGAFTGITVGAEYAFTGRTGTDWKIAVEYYQQNGEDPGNAPGQLAGREIFPDLEAIMVRLNFDFDW
ncbi:DUF3570 domain-containing protein [Algiphilus sp.]|uniref:DUF3570 domain-containing protein n=1 Tax=Algiphilus sp. TaxID=1872431 RepID=UPI003B51EDC6